MKRLNCSVLNDTFLQSTSNGYEQKSLIRTVDMQQMRQFYHALRLSIAHAVNLLQYLKINKGYHGCAGISVKFLRFLAVKAIYNNHELKCFSIIAFF